MVKITLISLFLFVLYMVVPQQVQAREHFFPVQAIDTMKFSRDLAREKLNSPEYDVEIDTMVKNIAETGATYVAIATPYDEEFIPYLKRWVTIARKYNLKVWFRGNWSGWEKWFNYPKIDRKTHITKTVGFISAHPELFEDGDIFVSCPECENGGPGDPRQTGDVAGFRNFLISENNSITSAFQKIGKKVTTNYYSMNGDVARLVMDKNTTKSLGGVVTVDHYVATQDKLIHDVNDFASKSGGNVVLGEFGAPIPDINGEMTETQQADWIDMLLGKIVENTHIIGLNYWTNKGSSTNLWNTDDSPRKVVAVLSKYYNPINISGIVTDKSGQPLEGVEIEGKERRIKTLKEGKYILPVLDGETVAFSKGGYTTGYVTVKKDTSQDIIEDVTLEKISASFISSLIQRVLDLLGIHSF